MGNNQSMLELIKVIPFIFSKERDQEAFDEFEMELYKWSEYAQEELGWDKKLLYTIIATPQVMNADKEISSNLVVNPPKLKSGSEDCDCNSSSSAGQLPCNYLMFQCHTGNCTSTTWGCGNIWLDGCNGLCKSR